MIATPRVGQEVLIDFLEGNPARPVVTGRLFNATQPVPYALPDNVHITGLRSRSTPGGGGFSEIAIHDAKSKELLNIRAQKDMVTTVLGRQSTVVHGASQVTHIANGSSTTWVQGSIEMQSRLRHIHITAQTEITLEAGASMLRLNANGIIDYRGVFRPVVSIKPPATDAGASVSQPTSSSTNAATWNPAEFDLFRRLTVNRDLPREIIAERVLRAPTGPMPAARDPAADDYQRLKTANLMKNALFLGTPASAPGAISALVGQDEYKIAAAHEIGGTIAAVQIALSGIPARAPVFVAPRSPARTKPNSKTQQLSSTVPPEFFKVGGGSDTSDFFTTHAYKHAYDRRFLSTKKRTQFDRDVNVRALREDAMTNPDSVSTKHGITKYEKEYPFNISTSDTPTGKMRVFVNAPEPSKSTQFPLFDK